MTSPDQDVANHLNGNTGAGSPALPEALAAMLYDAHLFGLSVDYAYPEPPNVSSSRYDQITTLAKLLTRTKKMPDGNDYTIWDAVMTTCKANILANPHINDDEPLSVKYKKPTAS
jgi:hypothetical protein